MGLKTLLPQCIGRGLNIGTGIEILMPSYDKTYLPLTCIALQTLFDDDAYSR